MRVVIMLSGTQDEMDPLHPRALTPADAPNK